MSNTGPGGTAWPLPPASYATWRISQTGAPAYSCIIVEQRPNRQKLPGDNGFINFGVAHMQSLNSRRFTLKALTAAVALSTLSALPALAAETIKVGILHSLSGTMAISETVLKDTVLMAIDEINAKGGVLGKKLEPVVVDPASNWPLFAEKTKQLLGQDKVAVIFGCWTSVSRKSVLPVVEEMNGLLFYPVQYEGEELSKNVFYTGAAPNQQAIPAVDYLMSKDGGAAKRWVLLHRLRVPAHHQQDFARLPQIQGRERHRH